MATINILHGNVSPSTRVTLSASNTFDGTYDYKEISFDLSKEAKLKNSKINSLTLNYSAGGVSRSQSGAKNLQNATYFTATNNMGTILKDGVAGTSGSLTLSTNGISSNSVVTLYAAIYGQATINNVMSGSATFSYTVSGLSLDVNYTPLTSSWTINKTAITANGSDEATVTITPGDNSYSHKLSLAVNGHSKILEEIAAGTKSQKFSIPKTWLQYFPKVSSIQGTLTLQTYNSDGDLIGSSSQKITVNAGSYIFKFTDPDLILNGSYNGYIIQNKTTATEEIKITSEGYSPITITWKAGSVSVNESYTPTTASAVEKSHAFGAITTTGSIAFSVTATDQRGFSATHSYGTKTSKAYWVPRITKFLCVRCNESGADDIEGAYAKPTLSVEYNKDVDSSNTAKDNGIKYYVRNNNNWIAIAQILNEQNRFDYVFDTGRSYEIKVDVTDKIGGTSSMIVSLSQSAVYMYWDKDAIGFFAKPSSTATGVVIGNKLTVFGSDVVGANYIEVTPKEVQTIGSTDTTLSYRRIYGNYPSTNPWFSCTENDNYVLIKENSLVEIGGALIVKPSTAGSLIIVSYVFGNQTRTWCRYFTVTNSEDEMIVLPRKIFEATASSNFSVIISCDTGDAKLISYEMGSINLRVLGRT